MEEVSYMSTLNPFDMLVYIGLVATLIVCWRLRRKLIASTQNNTQTQAQLINLASKLEDIEKQMDAYKRPRTGLLARWTPPKEDESAYTLSIYNDTNQRVFNVDIIIPKQYKALCQTYVAANFIDPDSWLEISMIPKRQEFAQLWFAESFKPVMFNVQYTEVPSFENPRLCPAPFRVSYAAKHFSEYLKRLSSDEESVAQTPSALPPP